MTFIIDELIILLIITNYLIFEILIFSISLIKTILLHNDDVIDDISMIEKIIHIFKEIMYLLKVYYNSS